ncbi:hypothetical protein GCM10010483_39260 [Actinokineospora diospyrosa]
MALAAGDRVELLDQTGLAQRGLPGVDVEHPALITLTAPRLPFVHDRVDAVQVQYPGEGEAT